MPRHGPWLDEKYRQPNTTEKKDSWSVAKCGHEIFLVKVHRAPRRQRFHPLHRSAPVDAKFLTGERVTKAFFLNPTDDGPGFLVSDRWDNPVIRSEAKWTGYTFLTMKNEALEGMRIQLEPANTADGPPWPAAPPAKDDDMDVHVGLHSEMLTPRRQRPNKELGLVSLRKQGWSRCLTRPANSTRLQELPQWDTIVVVASFDVVLLLWSRPLRALEMIPHFLGPSCP